MSDAARLRAVGKLLAWCLRHRPDAIGIALDARGWVDVASLLARLEAHGHAVTRDELLAAVAADDKGRFALDPGGARIRAQQGHSVAVDLDHPVATPPALLYHGTVARHLESIRRDGLSRGSRHDVHLSETRDTAARVGGRRGQPVILEVRAAAMAEAGHPFRRTPNGVWLVAHVPAEWIVFPA